MPSRGKQKQAHGDNDADQVLQAVILSDSFNSRFMPLTYEKPRCLLPVCNVPLIEYTIEFLAISGAQEIFIVATMHAEQIKAYIESSKWSKKNSSSLHIEVVHASECLSVGDALRELDARQLITTDFILVGGDVVSNMKLDKALEAHRSRKRSDSKHTDKNAIMTMVLKAGSSYHPSRARGEESVFVVDPSTSECVHYEPMEPFPRKKRIDINAEIFERHAEIECRNDLIDPLIDICSVEVPALFSENFDWQHLRSDFVRGVLTSDILGKTIYTYISNDSYAARIQNSQQYDSVSRDILKRWTFPIVPETNLQESDIYQFSRGNIYKGTRVMLSKSCIIEDNVQIGSGTVVGENSRVTNSVIGKNCKIGNNVNIEGAYLWDNVVIEDGVSIKRSIIANDAVILTNTTLDNGCIVSFGVTIGPSVALPKYTRVGSQPQPKDDYFDDEEESDEEEGDIAVSDIDLGEQGTGYIWTDKGDNDEDNDPRNLKVASLAFDLKDLSVGKEQGDDSDSASELGDLSDSDDERDSVGDTWHPEQSQILAARKVEEFKRELEQSISRAFAEDHTVELAALEITGLRMSANGSYDDVRDVIVPAIINQVDLSKPMPSIRTVLKKWGSLIGKVTHGKDDQVHVLHILQVHCADKEQLHKLFLPALQLLYDDDVVEEDAIFRWYGSDRSKQLGPSATALREKATVFIKWLQEAEEEDSDEDDE
ncbi:hypothetical protein INT44_008048 [Umbelopsis vinacea]|uniref:Translation initiation factor eIF2B subunit epsilon n=1 Tax=Umbelopsis vinacea TaxID=44442 RepID=A0A8H7PP62_9FUNG|nr:hypothetical protein INT44_008048 [Umbelopsis vinacea]KAI9285436.1 nucleotide-diphospho-sugar transferase [Umbelopsis sp. AD052]